VGVTLDDARAYAAWCGRRLPSAEEWQDSVHAAPEQMERIGYLWEWCDDGPEAGISWVMGGAFRRVDGTHTRSAVAHGKAYDYLGFRCVSDL
jgi:hypothetical protein